MSGPMGREPLDSERVPPTGSLSAAPIALVMCPLCFEASGRRVAIVAEYAVRPACAVTVAHLVGCEHGARFAQAGALTLAERQRLTRAALAMWEAEPRHAMGPCRDRGAGCRAERARRSLRRGHRTPR